MYLSFKVYSMHVNRLLVSRGELRPCNRGRQQQANLTNTKIVGDTSLLQPSALSMNSFIFFNSKDFKTKPRNYSQGLKLKPPTSLIPKYSR